MLLKLVRTRRPNTHHLSYQTVDYPFGILPGKLQTQLNAHMAHSRKHLSLPRLIPLWYFQTTALL